MVHRLTQNRLFMVALAALMLVALMPWQGALHCQGDVAATGGPCCCCVAKDAPPTGTCCCAPDTEDPKDPDPCPCIQVAKAVGLPGVVGPKGDEQAARALHPAAGPVAADSPVAVAVRVPVPRARTGPGLYLRLQVLLI